MADFLGLGGGIEKIEEYLGKRIAGAFIVLMVLAISAVGMRAIWDNLISPFAKFIQTPVWGQTILSYVWVALTIAFGVSVGVFGASALTRWKRAKELKSLISTSRSMMGEAQQFRSETEERLDAATSLVDRASANNAAMTKLTEKYSETLRLIVGSAQAWFESQTSLTAEERQAAEAKLKEFEDALQALDEREAEDAAEPGASVEQTTESNAGDQPA